MPPCSATPRPDPLNLEARVEELMKEKTELKKIKVDLEAKFNIAGGEVRRLKNVQLYLEARLTAANEEMGRIQRSLEDEMGRRQTAKSDRNARAAQEKKLMDEIERSRSNLESVKYQLGASNNELVMLKSTNERINTHMQGLLTEKNTMYMELVKTQNELGNVKSKLEKAKTNKKDEETLHQIKGAFLKFAAALFVYCTAMSMLKVVDPATNRHVEFFIIFNLDTLCSTISFISFSTASNGERRWC